MALLKRQTNLRILAILLSLVLTAVLFSVGISKEKPVGIVSGYVFDIDTHTPIAKAKVYHPTQDTYVKTDRDGKFTLYNVPTGVCFLYVTADRFRSARSIYFKVKEGEVVKDIQIPMEKKPPYYNMYSTQKMFSSNQTPTIVVQGGMVDKIYVEVYKLSPLSHLDEVLSYDRYRRIKKISLDNLSPVYKTTFTLPSKKVSSFRETVSLPVKDFGLYIVKTKTVGRSNKVLKKTTWFLKTDLALIVKRAPKRLLVYVQNYATGKPVKGANIKVFVKDKKKRKLYKIGVTDENGIFKIPISTGKSLYVITTSGGSFAYTTSYGYYGSQRKNYVVYMYTERPVYRPGQTVYFKGIVRRKWNYFYTVPQNKRVKVEVRDVTGRVILNKTYYTDEYGSFNGKVKLKLKDETPLGEYYIKCTIDDTNSYSYFTVTEYRKPEYKVEVSTDKEYYFPKEPVKIKIRGMYYFGTPAKGASYSISVYKSYYHYGGRWAGYEDSSYENVITYKNGVLNEEGEAEITLKAPKIDYNGSLKIDVTISDKSGRFVRKNVSVPLLCGEFSIFAYTDKFIYKPKQKINLHIEVLSAISEKPVSDQPVYVSIEKTGYREVKVQKQDGYGNSYTEYTIKEFKTSIGKISTVVTNADGKAEFYFTPPTSGIYKIELFSRDSKKNKVTYTHTLYVSEDGEDSLYTGADLKIILDKKKYNLGDTAKALITCTPKSYILLTIEGNNIYEEKVYYVEKGSLSISIPVKEEYFPNVFVSACTIKNRRLITDSANIKINRDGKKLRIKVVPNKKLYRPGELAEYTIYATDYDGKPVKADLSMGVIDEAIYSLFPEQVEDICNFFWGYTYNRVYTTYSLINDYSGGADKFDPSKLRRDFKDTAFWAPRIRTNSRGIAKVKFKMPDNLTTWVATVRGATLNTQVGSATSSVTVTKDLLVRLEVPRFLVKGDTIYIVGIVHNNTPNPQKVKVWLECEGVTLKDKSLYENVTVGAKDSKSFYWKVVAPKAGKAKFIIRCIGDVDQDGMELTIPVKPYGIEKKKLFTGSLKEKNKFSATFEISSTIDKNASKIEVRLSPSILASVLHNIDYLIHYPYGCVEQTMSSFEPAMVVKQTLLNFNALSPKMRKKIDDVVDKGISRLYMLQHADGGWGWWEADNTDPYMTAYVVMGLTEAKHMGYKIDPRVLKRGITALKSLLQKACQHSDIDIFSSSFQLEVRRIHSKKIFLLYALYKAGNPDVKRTLEEYTFRKYANSYAKALLAITLKGIGRDEEANQLLDELDKEAICNDYTCYWEGEKLYYDWMSSNIETTAYCLEAYLILKPEDPKVPKIVRWLLIQRKGDHYASTKDTAAVVNVLTHYINTTGEYKPNYDLSVKVNGKEILKKHIDNAILSEEDSLIIIPYSTLLDGKNSIEITKDGEGLLYYSILLRSFDKKKKILPKSQGIKISRQYWLLSREKTSQGTWEDVPSLLSRPLKRGERVRVKISVKPDEDYKYIIIEDPIPAGFEVDMVESRKNVFTWDARREVRDDKVVLFITKLEKGETHEFTYDLRAEMYGEMNVLPTESSCMYEPAIYGNTGAFKIEVEK